MLSDFFNQLIKTVHDIVSHPSAVTIIKDVAVTAEDVAGVIPEVMGDKASLVADVVNSALSVAAQNLPAAK